MVYTRINFKSKKEMKEAVDNGDQVRVYQPNAGMYGRDENDISDGQHCVEGPHYPQPHKWYATVEVKDGIVVKVK